MQRNSLTFFPHPLLPLAPQITSIPTRAGTFMGSITFRTPDGQMVWYAVEVRASEASFVDTVQINAQVGVGPPLLGITFMISLFSTSLIYIKMNVGNVLCNNEQRMFQCVHRQTLIDRLFSYFNDNLRLGVLWPSECL